MDPVILLLLLLLSPLPSIGRGSLRRFILSLRGLLCTCTLASASLPSLQPCHRTVRHLYLSRCKSTWPHPSFCSPSCSLAPSGFSSLVRTPGSHRVPRADQSLDITARSRAQGHGISSASWGAVMVSLHAYTAMNSSLSTQALIITTLHRRSVQHPRSRPPCHRLQLLRPRRRPIQQALQQIHLQTEA